jgi:hypothetical protein
MMMMVIIDEMAFSTILLVHGIMEFTNALISCTQDVKK